jgi:hypothetical protein
MTCTHTGLSKPECSCPECVRELLTENSVAIESPSVKPSTFPGKAPARIPGQTAFPSDDSASVWQVLYYDSRGRKASRLVPAYDEEGAELILAEIEQIPVTNVTNVIERRPT